jgi:glycosyltransferase involved in cell wall biosynthesis
MRIAFDLRRIGNLGVGRYMACLVNAIVEQAPQHKYVFIMAPGTERLLSCAAHGQVIVSSAAYYSVAEQFAIPMILRKYKADLLHALHFVVPIVKVCPTVVTIHDAIHFVYPEDLPSCKGRIYAKTMMKAAGLIADRILTVSEYSKADIVRYLGVDPKKIVVTHPILDKRFLVAQDAASLRRVKQRLGVTGDFILYVGIFRARKNHFGLLDAFAVLRDGGVRIQLVIAGPLGKGEKLLREGCCLRRFCARRGLAFSLRCGKSLCVPFSVRRIWPDLDRGYGLRHPGCEPSRQFSPGSVRGCSVVCKRQRSC